MPNMDMMYMYFEARPRIESVKLRVKKSLAVTISCLSLRVEWDSSYIRELVEASTYRIFLNLNYILVALGSGSLKIGWGWRSVSQLLQRLQNWAKADCGISNSDDTKRGHCANSNSAVASSENNHFPRDYEARRDGPTPLHNSFNAIDRKDFFNQDIPELSIPCKGGPEYDTKDLRVPSARIRPSRPGRSPSYGDVQKECTANQGEPGRQDEGKVAEKPMVKSNPVVPEDDVDHYASPQRTVNGSDEHSLSPAAHSVPSVPTVHPERTYSTDSEVVAPSAWSPGTYKAASGAEGAPALLRIHQHPADMDWELLTRDVLCLYF
ncbi:hypothetical protein BJ912DRAFT_934020 [Pholiota molesta]|nr:hypothetical protein BJ912DRAFT_934020 [Pholiota molesta]